MKKLTVIIISILFAACDCWDSQVNYSLRLRNHATHSIGCYFALGEKIGEFIYPDTSIIETDKYIAHEISPGGFDIEIISIQWAELLANMPQDTMSIFIFHTDTLNKYNWELIRSQYKVLKRYDFSIEDLKALKYDIPYPPTEEMKKMKMWP